MKIKIVLLLLVLSATAFGYNSVDVLLKDSKIYPGTTHELIVTTPDGYDGETLPVYLGLDGILCNAPEVIDSLSATGKIPRMIGIYLQPGVIRSEDGTVLRYNRSNEFDRITPSFAEFIESEVFPFIRDSLGIAIGEERMIFGLSSGGIAAFTAAWHRPDLFQRVFSGCGTFVPMRDGNDLQNFVRKTEPKPLRVFLQDGFSDTWNPLFGSWYEENRLLQSALDFAGYEAAYDWAEGGHSVRRATEIFPRVMEWIWRDYPDEIEAGTTENNLLKPLLIKGEEWEPLDEVIEPGPKLCFYPDSSIIAIPTAGPILSQAVVIDGEPKYEQPFYYLESYDSSSQVKSAISFDGDGNLWVLTSDGLQILDQNGRVRGILDLPRGMKISPKGAIRIEDGAVTISSDGRTYRRRLNVKAPKPGVRPPSQGQG